MLSPLFLLAILDATFLKASFSNTNSVFEKIFVPIAVCSLNANQIYFRNNHVILPDLYL